MRETSSPTKVYLLDDDPTFVDLVCTLLASVNLATEGFTDPDEFIKRLPEMTAGCILLDKRLPGIDGLEILDQIKKNQASLPVIIVTGHADVSSAVRAMKAGAFDFIEKPFKGQHLVTLVQKALQRDAETRDSLLRRKSEVDRIASLSKREREVLDLVVEGKASKAIARELGISIHTVDNHRANIMAKMNADSVADLVRAAVSAGSSHSTVSGRPGKKL
ncbi:MAG: Response regulator protein TmoT [Pseudomonadota bacterium]|jgi:FixJ family two-component response regulator